MEAFESRLVALSLETDLPPLVALMRPSASSRALEAMMRDLMDIRDGATYFAGRVCGVGIRYDLGGGQPLVGRSVPKFELRDGGRPNRILRADAVFF